MTDNTTSYAPPDEHADAAPTFNEDRVETPPQPEPAPEFKLLSFWDWVRARVLGQDVFAEYRQRLANLDQAIAHYPDAPANYLQRGEFHLRMGDHTAAAEDFHKALELAAADYEASSWGVLAQSVRDRAIEGLAEAGEKL
jgi:tetratricopeptide (TPR) repeat protein